MRALLFDAKAFELLHVFGAVDDGDLGDLLVLDGLCNVILGLVVQ